MKKDNIVSQPVFSALTAAVATEIFEAKIDSGVGLSKIYQNDAETGMRYTPEAQEIFNNCHDQAESILTDYLEVDPEQ